MAGQQDNGVTAYTSGELKNSKAYCEGMAHRASDTALNAPVTDNPHAASSEANACWTAGWNVADGAAGGTLAQSAMGSCSVTATIQV